MADRFKLTLFLLLIVALVLNLLTILTWNTSLTSNDGLQYLSTAKNWLAGNGFSTDALVYAPHFKGVLPAAQTVWPPGYPFVIGLTSKLGLPIETAPFTLGLVMHAASSLLMWLVIIRLGADKFFAAICAFLFYFMAVPWSYVTSGMTEPLFTALLLCALLFLPNPKHSSLLRWISCGLIIAAAICIRYSSVFCAFGTGAGLFVYLLLYERTSMSSLMKNSLKLTLMISLPVIAFAWLMYRTITLIGTLDRYSGSKIPETLSSTAMLWVAKASELMGFSANDLVSGSTASYLFVAFSLLVLSLVGIFCYKNNQEPSIDESGNTFFRLALLTIALHGLSLVIYLTINSIQTSPLEVLTRYLYQIYPGLYALFCYMLFVLFQKYSSGKKQRLLQIITSVLIATYLLAQLNSLKGTRYLYFREANGIANIMELPVTETVAVNTFIERCFKDNEIGKSIWSTHGQAIHLHTGIPTISYVNIYNQLAIHEGPFPQQVNDYQMGMFIFAHIYDIPATDVDYLDTIKQWLVDNGFVNVPMVSDSFGVNQTVEIYSKNPTCGI